MILWLNGALLPSDAARIDPGDRGFTLGDGVFETIAVREGAPRHVSRHLARLQTGLDLLAIPHPALPLAEAMASVLAANGLSDGVLRLTVSRGVAARGVLPQGPTAPPTVLIAAGAPPPALGPARLLIAERTRRNEFSPLSRIKSLNYLDNILARQEAAARGADDALILNTQGFVTEATAANLFLWLQGSLVTPPLADGALPGIARGLLIEGGAVERRLHPADLARAEGGFLSNSLGLRPIAAIGGRALPMLTERLAERVAALRV